MENQSNINHIQQQNNPRLPKYGIFQSLQHMMGAVKTNPVTFGVTLLLSYTLAGIVFLLINLAMTHLLIGEFGLFFASFGKILITLIVGLIVYTLLYALLYAFTVNCVAYALSNERYSIVVTLKKSLKSTVRIVKVNAWVAIVSFWPIVFAFFLPLLMLGTGSSGLSSPLLSVLTPILILAAFIWALIAQLRYALAPYVALYEPEVPARNTLKRSEQLLKKGGQWFVFKGVLLILALVILLAAVTGSNLRQLESSNDNAINAIFLVITILVQGAMVMLYLNRSGKKDPSSAPKSLSLTALVLAILLVLIGLTALRSNASNDDYAYSNSNISQADQEMYERAGNNIERRVSMKGLAQALEGFYNEKGYYPGENDIANPEWLSANLAELRPGVIVDPQGNRINSANSDYQYEASPEGCSKCASFELTAKLEDSDDYKQSSQNNTIKPGTNTTPTTNPSSR